MTPTTTTRLISALASVLVTAFVLGGIVELAAYEQAQQAVQVAVVSAPATTR